MRILRLRRFSRFEVRSPGQRAWVALRFTMWGSGGRVWGLGLCSTVNFLSLGFKVSVYAATSRFGAPGFGPRVFEGPGSTWGFVLAAAMLKGRWLKMYSVGSRIEAVGLCIKHRM